MFKPRKKLLLFSLIVILFIGVLSSFLHQRSESYGQEQKTSNVTSAEFKIIEDKETEQKVENEPNALNGEVLSETSVNQSPNNPKTLENSTQTEPTGRRKMNGYRLPDQTQDTPLPQILNAFLVVGDFSCVNRTLSLKKATIKTLVKYLAVQNRSTKVRAYLEFKNINSPQGSSPILEFNSPSSNVGWDFVTDFNGNPQLINASDTTETLEIQYRIHILEPNIYSSNWVYFSDVYCSY